MFSLLDKKQDSPTVYKKRSGEAGFTLVELLVVLVILVLLASLVAPRVIGYLGSSRTKTAKIQIANISTALELYKLDAGRYPSSTQGLSALVKRPASGGTWNGPYLKKKKEPLDPWKHAYHYRFPGQHGEYDLFSLGLDNQEGGDGENQDITNW